MKTVSKGSSINGARRTIAQEENLESVAYLCRRIMTANLRDLQAVMPDVDVTIGQLGTLVLVARNPGITPTEICRAQGFEKPTITASLNKLESKKFIVRKASSSDRRSFALHLTKRGDSFYSDMLSRIHESEQRLTRCLTGRERTQLLELLRRIFYQECKAGMDYGFEVPDSDRARPRAEKNSLRLNKRSASPRYGVRARASDRTIELGNRLKQMERQFVQLRRALRQVVRPAD